MRGREVPQRSRVCCHAWVIIFDQRNMFVLECELCRAVVSCEVGQHEHGHSFAFSIAQGRVSGDELAELGEWFGAQVGEYQAVHLDMRGSRRSRRRSPARAA